MGTDSFTVGSGTAKNRMVPPLSTQSIADMAAGVAPVQTMTWSAKSSVVYFFEFLGHVVFGVYSVVCTKFFGLL